MTRFMLGRLIRAAFSLLLLTLLVHGGLALLPGDPIRALFGPSRPDPAVYEAMRDQFNLNEPWIVQYCLYLRDLVTGNWGTSFPGIVRGVATVGPPIGDIVGAAAPVSAKLVAPVLAVQLFVGAAVGAIAAVFRRRPVGTGLYFAAVSFLGIPVIALAYVLQMAFAWQLGWVPTRGLDGWPSYVLPVTALSLTTACLLILFAREHLRDVLQQPFIKAPAARGIKPLRVVGIHAMKVSLPSFLTLVAANLGHLITSLIIVENIFGIPGLGSAMYQAIFQRDRALIIAMLLLVAGAVAILNLLVDASQVILDPRMRDNL